MSPPAAISPTQRTAQLATLSTKQFPVKVDLKNGGLQTDALNGIFEGDWESFKFDSIRESQVSRAMTRRYFKVSSLALDATSLVDYELRRHAGS